MGGACGAYGGGERCARVLVGNLRVRSHWGDLDVEGRIILSWLFGKWKGWTLDGVGSG